MSLAHAAVALALGCGGSRAPVAPAPPAVQPPSVEPARYAVREHPVTFPGRDLMLEGTLTVPVTCTSAAVPVTCTRPPPRPGVVLVHGSGPQSRDELLDGQLGHRFGFDVRVFADLADALGRAGFAVLRYDKRSCWAYNGCENAYPEWTDVAFADLAGDARAALDYLAARDEVDGDRLVVVGHSQGASLVPLLMESDPRVRAGAMLAGLHDRLDEALAGQVERGRAILAAQGVDSLFVNVAVFRLEEVARQLRRLRAGRFHRELLDDLPVAFWQQWMAEVDAAPARLARLDRPVLILSGDADVNVPPAETEAWRRTVAALGEDDPGHRVVVLPCVSHALNCIDEAGDPARHVDSAVLEHLVRFVRQSLSSGARTAAGGSPAE